MNELDQLLEKLQLLLNEALDDTALESPEDIHYLVSSYKLLLESKLLQNHVDALAQGPSGCCGGGCGCAG